MKFTAYARTVQGTGASRRLRDANKVPGIVYGAGTPTMIELDHNALFHALKKEAFHASILEMELDGKVEQVLLRDHQVHPYKPLVLHADFQRIDGTTRITKRVPVHYVGEENSPAVKLDKCVINHIATELQIECLASALPEHLTVDLSNLTKSSSLHLADVSFADGIKVVTHGKKNPVLATAVLPVEEEEITPVVAAPADAKKGKGKKDEKQNKK